MITARGARILMRWVERQWPRSTRPSQLRIAANRAQLDTDTFLRLLREGEDDSSERADHTKTRPRRAAAVPESAS